LLDNQDAVAIAIFQAPGSNALQLSTAVRGTMASLRASFPQGVEYRVVYDPTQFVRQSIVEVVRTLLAAVLLVVITVVLFLQTWRASIIPLVAVPISIVGTFAINSLTLSPALSALLLQRHGAPPDAPTRVLDRLFGWIFRPFNRLFARASAGYGAAVARVVRRSAIAVAVYAGLVALAALGF